METSKTETQITSPIWRCAVSHAYAHTHTHLQGQLKWVMGKHERRRRRTRLEQSLANFKSFGNFGWTKRKEDGKTTQPTRHGFNWKTGRTEKEKTFCSHSKKRRVCGLEGHKLGIGWLKKRINRTADDLFNAKQPPLQHEEEKSWFSKRESDTTEQRR